MQDLIIKFKEHVNEVSANPSFIHNAWFVQYHLEIVEKISLELLELYPIADKNLVAVMVWLHDYGKIIDFAHQYEATLIEGKKKLLEIGFPIEFVDKAVQYIEILDKKLELDLRQAPLEVQIVSSADGCSHLVGPFYFMWWYENPNKKYVDLMEDNIRKAMKDWNYKIVLPEAREVFEIRHKLLLEHCGQFPNQFFI